MEISTSLFAIGPFKKDIINYLPYKKELYKDTRKGTIVIITFIFECITFIENKELVKALNINELDLSTYKIIFDNINWNLLEKIDIDEAQMVKYLLDNNFDLFYLQDR